MRLFMSPVFATLLIKLAFAKDKSFTDDETVFRALFKQKRVEQLRAVKSILKLGGPEKQSKMVNVLFEKIFEILLKNKADIEASDYIPGNSFPSNEVTREALSQILENTAFFGDIVLRLPDVSHSFLERNKEWEILAQWSIGFSNSTDLLDDGTVKMVNLVAQELRLVEPDPTFVNPFKNNFKESQPVSSTPDIVKVKKKKKIIKKGPQLGGSRYDL